MLPLPHMPFYDALAAMMPRYAHEYAAMLFAAAIDDHYAYADYFRFDMPCR